MLVQAGAPDRPARVIGFAIAVSVLAIAWRRQSFVLFVAAAILLSPIVWLDYFALLAIPLAVVQPRLSLAWVLPILVWGITSGGAGAGHVEPSIRVLAVFTAVTVLVARSEGRAVAGLRARLFERFSGDRDVVSVAVMTRRAINFLADNSLLVLVFCAVGALVLAAFAPARVVADTWMTLVAGREIIDHGLPHVDHLTINGAGRTWTDQQWLAHLVLYGSERLGGFGFLTIFSGLSVMLAYAIGLIAARSRGATTRATLMVFMVVAFAASWTWTVRAQVLVLPLFAAVVVLAVDARDGIRRRTWLMIPILVLWGNLHGSASLGALIASAVGVLELARRRHAWQALALAVTPWLALLVTPYTPASTVRYYRLVLVDPPFADVVGEWARPGVAWSTLGFGILLLATVLLVLTGWRRFALTELVVLAITAAVALQAIRGIYWFSIACLVILPPAIDRALGWREPPPLRSVGRVVSLLAVLGLVIATIAGGLTTDRRVADSWPTAAAVPVRAALRDPATRVYPTDRFADWLLWTLPELRGRMAFDIRFEVYTRAQMVDNVRFNGESGKDWKRVANGYRIITLDNIDKPSHLADLLAEPGARVVYRNNAITVVDRGSPD